MKRNRIESNTLNQMISYEMRIKGEIEAFLLSWDHFAGFFTGALRVLLVKLLGCLLIFLFKLFKRMRKPIDVCGLTRLLFRFMLFQAGMHIS